MWLTASVWLVASVWLFSPGDSVCVASPALVALVGWTYDSGIHACGSLDSTTPIVEVCIRLGVHYIYKPVGGNCFGD